MPRRGGAHPVARLGLCQGQGRAPQGGVIFLPSLKGRGDARRAAGWVPKLISPHLQSQTNNPPRPFGPTLPLHGTVKEINKMAPRVLISDSLSSAAVQIFRDHGIAVDMKAGI